MIIYIEETALPAEMEEGSLIMIGNLYIHQVSFKLVSASWGTSRVRNLNNKAVICDVLFVIRKFDIINFIYKYIVSDLELNL